MTDNIVDINYIVLRFPVSHFISGWKRIDESWHLIALVKTNDSVYGIGEGTPYSTSIGEDYATAIKLKRTIVGKSLEEAIQILNRLEHRAFLSNEKITYGAFLAVESAILDALAKLKKTSIARQLGGEYRGRIPVSGTVFLKHPYKMAEEVNMWISRGVRHIKIKVPCNLDNLEKTLKTITEKSFLKEANAILRVDVNQCFEHYNKAVKALKIMEKYEVNIVEQPLPKNALRDTAKLRKAFNPVIKIMLDESLTKPWDIKLFAELEAADIVNFHPSKLGCLTITREAILRTQKLGMEAQVGSALMTEIGLTQYLNLAASISRLDHPLEEVGLLNLYGYAISSSPEKYVIRKGSILVQEHVMGLKLDTLRTFARIPLKPYVIFKLASIFEKLKRRRSKC